MPERGIAALGRFARVVSDEGAVRDVLGLLAEALYEHVSPAGVAVFILGPDDKLRLVAERGVPEAAVVEVNLDDVAELPERVRAALGGDLPQLHALIAGAALYGDVLLLSKVASDSKLALANGLIDLAAVALGTAAHLAQLERQAAEIRMQQEILARTEKLRALGQMAAGVSHDLGNLLNPLSLHLQIIGRALDRGKLDDAKESTVQMRGVLQRGLETLDRLRKFSRQSDDTGVLEVVELDRLAREAVALGKARAASPSDRLPTIVEELTSPPAVNAIGAEVVSALVNLIVNAIDAGARRIILRSGTNDARSWIEIADDGPGMPADVAARVFEPFFTTKGEEGTGLGLAMVKTTMDRHGGAVTVDTAPGRGACFRLSFPR